MDVNNDDFELNDFFDAVSDDLFVVVLLGLLVLVWRGCLGFVFGLGLAWLLVFGFGSVWLVLFGGCFGLPGFGWVALVRLGWCVGLCWVGLVCVGFVFIDFLLQTVDVVYSEFFVVLLLGLLVLLSWGWLGFVFGLGLPWLLVLGLGSVWLVLLGVLWLGWVAVGCGGLCWVGLLCWVGSVWVGLVAACRVPLPWVALGCVGLGCCVGLGSFGLGWVWLCAPARSTSCSSTSSSRPWTLSTPSSSWMRFLASWCWFCGGGSVLCLVWVWLGFWSFG